MERVATEVMAAQGPGNTKAVPCARAVPKGRAWLLTLNEVDRYEELLAGLQSYKTMDYLISCKEQAPSTGHEHIHVYMHFRAPIRLSLKKTAGAHVERCNGSPQQNIAYIEKEGVILDELGERPRQGTRNVKDLLDIEKAEDLEDWHEYNTWLKLKQRPKKVLVKEWHKEVEVVYITGPSGVGKSLGAKQLLEERGVEEMEEVKYEGGFWHGVVDGTGAAVYDDFRSSHLSASEFINFIDYNAHSLNVKGGSVRNRYNLIIITSIQRPEELYRNMPEEARTQWMRRIRVVNLYPDNGDLADLELE
uniref:ATP-dependent helicase Rep n=1 Tax=CRESS DNA virus TaxID=3138951 RepID=A0AAU8H7R7_9VIRU